MKTTIGFLKHLLTGDYVKLFFILLGVMYLTVGFPTWVGGFHLEHVRLLESKGAVEFLSLFHGVVLYALIKHSYDEYKRISHL